MVKSRPRITLYEDLNCPFCYALTEMLEEHGLLRKLAWRGVEHAPDAPTPWVEPGPVLKRALVGEVAAVRRRAPQLPLLNPFGQPNTGYAIASVARAFKKNEHAALALRSRIKRALFRENMDISSPELIDRLQRSVALEPGAPDRETADEIRSWHAAWSAMSPRMIPTLVGPDGKVRPGLGDPGDALEFVRSYESE